jgi:cellulose synthase/poly-beta-1,6-N-acetylglucosamine synthase-like glycosyltransferase
MSLSMMLFLNILAYVVWFLATFFLIAFMLVLVSVRKELYQKKYLPKGTRPLVSIVVPAYNEEGKIAETIDSLKKVTYAHVEFIIVNDGSKDNTSKEVRLAIKGDKRFSFIDRKKNIGKAASLNEGIWAANGEYVACMDADSMVEPKILEKTLAYMVADKKVGAVTVSVDIHRKTHFLHNIIDVEYNIGLSLFLKVFASFNGVFVTPGPFTLFRRSMLVEIKGFDPNNITEDLEIAYRIHKAGYKIESCLTAHVRTICPETFKGIYVQRRRWYSGAIQTWFKHKDLMMNSKYGLFAYFVPFHIALLLLGILLFALASIVSIYNTAKYLVNFRHTGFNFFERLFDSRIDLLTVKQVSIIGYTSFIAGIAIMLLSLYFVRANILKKKTGVFWYPMLFLLYQMYWIGALYTVVRGKKIAWR